MAIGPQTHCKRGHAYTAANTLMRTRADGRTYRNCRTCHRLEMREYRKNHPRPKSAAPRVDAFTLFRRF